MTLKPLTIDDIKDRLKSMVVNNDDVLPIHAFHILVKNPDDNGTEYLLVRNAIFANCVHCQDGTKNYYDEELINKFQHLIQKYGEIYKLY